ncbi:MAG: LysR family transcriptional regulator [Firmicutes bacterium]|nr:LysR family transcriptional regulator [Bacillota bacterium]
MELNQLRSFCLIAESKSFSRAAEKLHLTQPAVTLQIKNLEEELGQLLFERLGHTLGLTAAGEVLLGYARQILNLTETATETIRQFCESRGRITIGAGTTNTIFRLPRILQKYREAHPQVEIRIRNGASDLIGKLVYENAVDLGLVTTINPEFNVNTVPLYQDRISLIAPRGYGSRITKAELEEKSLIMFRAGSGFHQFLMERFHKQQYNPNVTMELESIEAIIRLVQSGLGLAFLPEIAVLPELKSGELIQVEVHDWPVMIRQTYLIYRRDKYLTWPIKAFLSHLVQENV